MSKPAGREDPRGTADLCVGPPIANLEEASSRAYCLFGAWRRFVVDIDTKVWTLAHAFVRDIVL